MYTARIVSRTGVDLTLSTDAELVSHEQGGCLSATLPHDLPAATWGGMLGADVYVFGPWGTCWEGFIIGTGPDTFECAGKDVALSDGFEVPTHRVYRDNSTELWALSQSDENDYSVATGKRGGLNFAWAKNTPYEAEACAAFVYEFESTQAYASVVASSLSRTDTNYALKAYGGVYDPTSETGEPYVWTLLGTWDGSGTSQTFTTANVDALKLRGYRKTNSGVPAERRKLRVGSVVVRTIAAVTSPTVANVAGDLLDTAPSFVTIPWRELSVTTAISRVVSEGRAAPIETMRSIHERTGTLWRWLTRRAGGVARVVPTSLARPTTTDYLIDVRAPGVVFAPSGSGLLDLANKARYTYDDASTGEEVRATRTATSSALTSLGIDRWTNIDVDTDSSTVAQATTDAKLSDVSGTVHRGTCTTPIVLDYATLTPVPVEHVECGRRVAVMGYGPTFTARIVESKVRSGIAELTLDSAPYSLDYAIAAAGRAKGPKGPYRSPQHGPYSR